MLLTTSFLTAGTPPSNEVSNISVSGSGVNVKLESRTTTGVQGTKGEVSEVRTTFSVDVSPEAALGLRNLTFQFFNADPKTFGDSFEISRGRVVIFAIDGLSDRQFDVVIEDANTALNEIFVQTEAKGQSVNRQVSTTFAPITFTRWATIFSGEPPGKTLIPSITWFNRQALIGGPANFGDPNQGLGISEGRMVINALFGSGAYNRHFTVDLVYDKLRRKGFQSIVINQQAGLGKGNAQEDKLDDDWPRVRKREIPTLIWQGSVEDDVGLSNTFDRNSVELALDAIGRTGGDFDLMVVYLPGLDHFVHALGESEGQGETWFQVGATPESGDSLHERIREIDRALGDLRESTVFGVFSDHGHFDVIPNRFMDLENRGQFVEDNDFPTWQTTLQVNDKLRVGDKFARPVPTQPTLDVKQGRVDPNVILVPQGGMAHVYVAGDIKSRFDYDWTKPPSLTDTEPIVNSIFLSYVDRPWPERPVADILVRVSSSPDSFEGSRYKLVPRNYDPDRSNCGDGTERCGLEEQLVEIDELENLGIGENPPLRWTYNDPKRRIEEWISVNTGDIILLVNGRDGFHFSARGLNGQHGSLTFADSLVPVAFGYPGATSNASQDNTMATIRDFLDSFDVEPIQAIVEAQALEKFFFGPEP
jgi:hypothetical protein